MKKILLIATIAFTMNVNAGGDMFSDGKCLSDTRLVAKHLQKMYLSEDEIREELSDTGIFLLVNADCLLDVNLLAKRLLRRGVSEDKTIAVIGGRLLYELNKMLDELFK